jgi:hypothetical protein
MSTHDFDCASVDRKSCLRAYTPTSMEDEVGHFGLDAKEYILDEHSKFLNGGLMNQLMDPLPLCWGPSASEGPQKRDLTMFLEYNT